MLRYYCAKTVRLLLSALLVTVQKASKSQALIQAPADFLASLRFYVPLYKMKRLVAFTHRNEKNIQVIHRKCPISNLKKKTA